MRRYEFSLTLTSFLIGRYCTRPFNTYGGLQRHKAGGSPHRFLKNRNIKDEAVHLASTPGGLIASGSRPDRAARGAGVASIPSPASTAGSAAAVCYRKFHRRPRVKPYLKPKKLHLELRRLFEIKPVISPERAYEILKSMRDADGGLMFCWTKRGEVGKYAKTTPDYAAWEGCLMCGQKPCSGCNGKCPTFMEIKSYFSDLAQKRKKQNSTK